MDSMRARCPRSTSGGNGSATLPLVAVLLAGEAESFGHALVRRCDPLGRGAALGHSPASEAMRGSRASSGSEKPGGGKDRSTTCGSERCIDGRCLDPCAPRRSPRVVPPSPASRTAFARRPLPLVAWRLAGEASRLPVSQTPRVATRGRGVEASGLSNSSRGDSRERRGAFVLARDRRVASSRVSKGAPGVSLTPPRCAGTPTAWARRRAVPPRRGGTPRRPRSPRRTAPAAGCSR